MRLLSPVLPTIDDTGGEHLQAQSALCVQDCPLAGLALPNWLQTRLPGTLRRVLDSSFKTAIPAKVYISVTSLRGIAALLRGLCVH